LTLRLRVEANATVLTEGDLRVGVIDADRVVIFGYTPDQRIPNELLDQHPSLEAFLDRYGR
jgi:hypothetical protein